MKKTIPLILLILLLVGGYFGWKFYKNNLQDNVKEEGVLLVPRTATLQQIMDSIRPYLKDAESFQEFATKQNLEKNFKAGRYEIKKGEGNKTLINKIRQGLQTDLPFRIKDFDDVYQMIGRVARKTEADSLTFVKDFNTIARLKNLKSAEDLKPYFFADTYNFYWTVTPEDFFKKFENIYNDFWTEENINKEKNLGLDRIQVYTLASIVLRESGGKPDEQKRIAGLYLNRLHKGMKLQSDPTVIYAINKENNFTKKIKRVYYKDLKTNSSYNTYMYSGLPPGPICVVDKTSVENVLNAEENNFLYMVADPEKPGLHKFTDDPAIHEKNANIYRNWLNKNKIK